MGFWRRLGSFLALGSGSSVAIWLALPPDSAIRRTGRTAGTVVLVGADYKLLQLRKLSENPEKLAEMHTRNAKRMLNFCSQQGGMFTKFGQHVSSVDRAVPMQYKEALAMLQDKAQAHSMDSTRQTIREEMKADISDIFEEFDPVPVASASLAQVHRAKLRSTHQEVAVKVQHPRVRQSIPTDLWSLDILAGIVIPYFFDGIDLQWIVDEFRRNLSQEMDFRNEAANGTRALQMFLDNPHIKIPAVYEQLSSERVLLMEFVRGVKLKNLDLLPDVRGDRVARTLLEAFAQMIFVNGFVHGDPHQGNLLVTPSTENPDGYRLVILDHGLYRELPEKLRLSYCHLWQSLVSRDIEGVKKAVESFGMPGFSDFFSMMLVQKPVSEAGKPDATDGKMEMSKEDRQRHRKERKKMKGEEANKIMEALPKDLLVLFRTQSLVQAICKQLGANDDRLSINARYALKGLYVHNGSKLQFWADSIRLEAIMTSFSLSYGIFKLVKKTQGILGLSADKPQDARVPFG